MRDVWFILKHRPDLHVGEPGRQFYELLFATRQADAATQYFEEKRLAGDDVRLVRQVLPLTRPPDSISTIDF